MDLGAAEAVLMSLLVGGLLVPVVGAVINLIEEVSGQLAKGTKRIIALLLTAIVGIGSYVLAVYGGFWAFPATNGEVVRDLLMLISLLFTSSQTLLAGFRSDTFQRSIGSANMYVSRTYKNLSEDILPERFRK